MKYGLGHPKLISNGQLDTYKVEIVVRYLFKSVHIRLIYQVLSHNIDSTLFSPNWQFIIGNFVGSFFFNSRILKFMKIFYVPQSQNLISVQVFKKTAQRGFLRKLNKRALCVYQRLQSSLKCFVHHATFHEGSSQLTFSTVMCHVMQFLFKMQTL